MGAASATSGRRGRAVRRAAATAAGPIVLATTMLALGFSSGGFPARTQAILATVYIGVTIVVLAFSPGTGDGLRGRLLVALVAIWAFAGWTLLSGRWSGAPARADIEFVRVVLYASTLVLFVLLGRGRRAVGDLLAALACACLVICLAALMTRLLPDASAIGIDQRSFGRLQYPVNYPATLGLLAAVGGLLSLSFAAASGRSTAMKIAGAAATPVFATTLLLTYSRGPILAGAVALIVFLAVGMCCSAPGALLATGPTTAAACLVAYHAGRLATSDFVSARAVSQGHRTALILAICAGAAALLRAVALGLDRSLERVMAERRRPARLGRGKVAAGAIALGLVLAAIVVAVELPALQQGYARFAQPGSSQSNTRARLTDVQGGDRLQAWKVALADFRGAPVLGRGAGTFVLSWSRHRPYEIPFNETHSLYLQMLGELGLVGAGLLALALAMIIGGVGIGIRGPGRVTFAAALAVVLGWAVAVSVDWHWQMPVGTLWLFAIGGAALAGRRQLRRGRRPGKRLARGVGVVALVAAAVLPVRVAVAESHLQTSLAAFRVRDCRASAAAARAARSALGTLSAPLMLLGYCAAIEGDPASAVRLEEQAVSRDPDDWVFRYALANVRAAEGLDPRPAARAALRLNPLEPLVTTMVHILRGGDPRGWRRQASTVAVVLPSMFDP